MDKIDLRAAVTAFLITAALFLTAHANAEEPVVLEYLPEPTVIDVFGDTWFAYTFDQFRELARLDVRFQAAEEREQVLRLSLAEHEEALAEMEADLDYLVARAAQLGELYEAAEAANEDALTRLEGCQTALGLCEQRESGIQFWHPVYVPFVAVLSVSLVLALR